MTNDNNLPLQGIGERDALESILKGTSSVTGSRFFSALVESLSEVLNTHIAWVTEYLPDEASLGVLAFEATGDATISARYPLAGTPCEPVVLRAELVHYPDDIRSAFPNDKWLRRLGVRSYLGVPLVDLDEVVLGHLAVMDVRPMPAEPRYLALFRIFAARAAAELQRIRAEAQSREHELQLSQIFDGAMDAIVQLDKSLNVTMMNPAAEKLVGANSSTVAAHPFARYLDKGSSTKLGKLVAELENPVGANHSLWIPDGLKIKNTNNKLVPAEATLSGFDAKSGDRYTLILRDVNDRIEAERQINTLTAHTRYLTEEIQTLAGFDGIIGSSSAMRAVLEDVDQVAATNATVLVLGETGTGKELIARAVHNASGRANQPLIKVNCGALPESLIESELFGHEKGAFTGATHKRVGRFAMADGGSLFLDEIGDLPIELQVKLLRVLQEGDFEAVGSSTTKHVDVRVIAATNRDLIEAMEAGKFREDLYYRLAVFPVRLPPLRERVADIEPLARAFFQRYARGLGRDDVVIDEVDIERLCAYPWPGNIRELQNVIERALITATDGRLNLARALPEFVDQPTSQSKVQTAAELEEQERANFLRALEQTNWLISGEGGAAQLLGVNPSTLNSRLKTLGIKRPGR